MGEFTPTTPDIGLQAPLSRDDMAQFILRGGQQMSAATKPDQLKQIASTNIFPTGMNYVSTIQQPSRAGTEQPMDPAWEKIMAYQGANRLNTFTRSYDDFHRLVGEVQGMHQTLAQQDPEAAKNVMGDHFWDQMIDKAENAGRSGVGAVTFLLRNLDRGRGAVASYLKSINDGSTQEDALRRSYDVLRGSDHGWVLDPEKMGPSGADILRGMGYDDGWGTRLGGFALDVAIDPINLLGIGASRKGLQIGAHQILNNDGRDMWISTAKRLANEAGYAEVSHAPMEVQDSIVKAANLHMRNLVNSGPDVAKQYLDLGGLKIAGMTLVNAPLNEVRYVRKGQQMVAYESQSLAHAFGSKILEGADKIGSWSEKSALPLPARLREVGQLLPSNIRAVGERMALLFNRTNPLAGEDYRIFKQAEYYDRLGFEHNNTINALGNLLGKFDHSQLDQMTWAIDRGTVEQLPQDMQQAIKQYQALTDASLIEEVKRGIMRPDWSTERREQFADWVAGKIPTAQLDEQTAKMFTSVRLPNYVTHVYRNTELVRKLTTRGVRPGPPSITEGYAFRRIVPTLDEAVKRGLVPETNLFKLAAYRLTSANNAITTYDFLRKTAEEFGEMSPQYAREMEKLSSIAGDVTPYLRWQQYLMEKTTDSGMLAGDAARHMQIAREISRERGVPAELIQRLDDDAKREFLMNRFRTVSPKKAENIWRKYVERPSALRMYDGYGVAPAADAIQSAAKARELYDPVYGAWEYMTVAGRTDPAILHRLLLPEPIVRDLERLKGRVIAPELHNMLRLMDIPQFWWKQSVTLPFPSFHFRNKITNLVNSSLEAGLGVITDRPTMYSIMWGGSGVLRAANGRTYTYDEIRQLARRHGVMLSDFHRADIGSSIDEAVNLKMSKGKGRIPLIGGENRLGVQSIANPLAHPLTAMREGAATIENSDRLLVFINSLKRGLSPELAADRVSRVMFDWQDLSQFEKVVRHVIPFYTWTRKNLALQVKATLTQPGRQAMWGKLARNLSAESDNNDVLRSDVERQLLPQAMSDDFGIRSDVTPQLSHWLLNFDLPMTDLDKMWAGNYGATMNKWVSQLNPAIKAASEAMVGENFYTGQKTAQFGSNSPVYDFMLKAPDPVKRFLGLEQVIQGDHQVVKMDSGRYQKLMWVLMASGLSRFYSTVGNVTNPNVNLTHRLWQLFTGAKVRAFDQRAEMARRADTLLHGDQGLIDSLRQKKRELLGALMLKSGTTFDDQAADKRQPFPSPDDVQSESDILTPKTGNELDELYGLSIP